MSLAAIFDSSVRLARGFAAGREALCAVFLAED
jgi:hypothetical protein